MVYLLYVPLLLVYKQNFNSMKQYMKKLIYVVFCALSVISMIGCEKFIHTDLMGGDLSDKEVFRDSLNAEAAVIGVYLSVNSGGVNSLLGGGMTIMTALAGDELFPTSSNLAYREFYDNGIDPSNSINEGMWVQAYKQIYLANACLEGLETVTYISKDKRQELIGEVLQIRAANYFYLSQLYGNVPLVLSTDYRENIKLANESVENIYTQIIQDLQLSLKYLKNVEHDVLRANYFSALGLLAKVYLLTGRYDEAGSAADEIINSGLFLLEANVGDVFAAESKETFWSWVANDQSLPSMQTFEGLTLQPSSATIIPAFSISESLANLFEEGDKRFTEWVGSNTVNGQVYLFPNKYQVHRPFAGSRSENYVIFRLAEQYLIRAESRVRNDDMQGGLSDLNIIRTRAGLERINLTDQESLLGHVLIERRRELFCEWGNRWLDLKRMGLIQKEMNVVKELWNEYAILFPIPKNELDRNTYLIQNPGY